MLATSPKGLLTLMSVLFLSGYTTTVLGSDTVKSYAVESKPLSELITHPEYRFSAEIKPHTVSVISSELNAKLNRVLIRPGVNVNKGQVLARMDCADTQAQLDQVLAEQQGVQANLELTQLQINRLQNLEDKQLVSTNQLDEARTQQKALQANLQGLKVAESSGKRAVARCQITSPYDAVVTEIMAGEGQWLGMGTPVFELYRTDQAEIEVSIPLALASQYQRESAQWTTNVSSAKTVTWLRQSAVLESRQRMAKVWFKAPDKQPLGLAGTLLLTEPADYLPVTVIVQRQGVSGVFINEAGKAQFKAFESAEDGRPARVPADWNSDWLVIVKGHQRLQSGDELK